MLFVGLLLEVAEVEPGEEAAVCFHNASAITYLCLILFSMFRRDREELTFD